MVAVADSLKGRSFTRVADWSSEDLLQVLDLADELKRLQQAGEAHHLLAGRKLGMIFVAATPASYRPDDDAVRIARDTGGSVELTDDPRAAVAGADVLYTDVWTSMGQDAEREQRLRDLDGYGIDAGLVALAGDGAIVLHCLPAHYGEEIAEEVLYGPQSAVWDQAENRLHSQKALMALVMR